MHHEGDLDLAASAHAIDVIADIPQNESDLLEIGQMIGDLGHADDGGLRMCRRCRPCRKDPGAQCKR